MHQHLVLTSQLGFGRDAEPLDRAQDLAVHPDLVIVSPEEVHVGLADEFVLVKNFVTLLWGLVQLCQGLHQGLAIRNRKVFLDSFDVAF